MVFAQLLTLGAFGALVAASPMAEGALAERGFAGFCLSQSQAQQVATSYGTLISSYSATLANETLTPGYTDYSESVNSLIDSCPTGTDGLQIPLLGPTASSRANFEAAQAGQPNNNYQQLELWYTCNTVIWRWETTNGAGGPRPVVGLIVAEVVRNPQFNAQYPWLINEVYSEFDAAAWLQNLIESGDCPASSACATTAGLGSSVTTAASSATATATGTNIITELLEAITLPLPII